MRTQFLALGLVLLALPFFAFAAALVDINTADATLLDTLPGIGPTYAARIVDYRTAHGPFARTEDIQNVAGIGPSTFADIKPFITVGDTGKATTETVVASSTPSASASSGTATYVPPPLSISVQLTGEQTAIKEVPLHLSARVTTKGSTIDPGAHIKWSFGDGSSGEGSEVDKTYRYTGTYLVVVTATDGQAIAHDDLTVTVAPAQARVSAVSIEGITLANDSSERLDLSGWRLTSEFGSFRIPVGTTLLPNASVLLPYTITNLPMSFDVTLMYPNGVIAARYMPPASVVEQPLVPAESYKQVKEVEPITSQAAKVEPYAETVIAPTTTEEPAAVGAAVPPLSAAGAAEAVKTPATGLFHSVWTLGLLGVMTLAAGVFILL